MRSVDSASKNNYYVFLSCSWAVHLACSSCVFILHWGGGASVTLCDRGEGESAERYVKPKIIYMHNIYA